MKADDLVESLRRQANVNDAVFLQRFFRTGPGEYGEGDEFIGVRVPATRLVCKEFKDLPLTEVQKLLDSPIHECRLAAVIILSKRYPKADETQQQAIFDLYLNNLYKGRINNWDIIDSSAEHIVGAHLMNRPRKLLFKLAKSNDLWQRRVSIMSTFIYLKNGDASTTLELAGVLLHDKQDLIHKAVGWMLRETGSKVDKQLLIDFLDKHAAEMPRTMLRYSIEHLSLRERPHYMRKRLS